MKNLSILPLIGVLMAGVMPSAQAFQLWQIGASQEDAAPNAGASEFEGGTDFFDVYNYNVDTNPDDEINAPNFTGYLFTDALSTIDPNRTQIWTAREANINFNLDQDYSDAILSFGRYGSEINEVFLDNTLIERTLGPGEGAYELYNIGLGDLLSGAHVISLRYAGGGVDNGNYIDALKLNATPESVPISATLGLVVIGAVGFLRRRERYGKVQR